MESAVLVLLASSMGVLFGWQPMLDGSPKVEYLVQLEPELVARLQEGQTIPITSDIPDDIGPIGRIRIVVGSGELPRQKLVTQFKPWPKQRSPAGQLARDGIVETQQYAPSGGNDRYGTAPTNAQILPPGSGTSVASNPLGRALQQGAEEARNLASDVKQILPPSEQLFGSGGGTGQDVQNAFNNAAGRLQQGLQQGVQRGVQQVTDNLEQRAREAITGSQQSILSGGQRQAPSTILPPSSQPSSPPSSPQGGQVGGGQRTPRRQRIDEPVNQPQPALQQRGNPTLRQRDNPTLRQRDNPAPRQRDNIAPRSSFAETPDSNPAVGANPAGDFNASWPPAVRNPSAGTPSGFNNPPPSLPASQSPSWSSQPNGRNSSDLANRSHDNHNHNPPPSFAGDNRQPTAELNNNWSGGSQFPTGQQRPAYAPPAIHSANANADPGWPPKFNSDLSQQQMAGSRPQNLQGRLQVPMHSNDFSSDANRVIGQMANAASPNGMPDNSKLMPLLFSWVLLTGSGVGNAYLWWSYLDVRSKYQGVVRGSGRRDRYDD